MAGTAVTPGPAVVTAVTTANLPDGATDWAGSVANLLDNANKSRSKVNNRDFALRIP
jgi:hypothetical protein